MTLERYQPNPAPVIIDANQQMLANSVFGRLTNGKEESLSVIVPKIPENRPPHSRIPIIVASTSTKYGTVNLDLHIRYISPEKLAEETGPNGSIWNTGTQKEEMPYKPDPTQLAWSAFPDPFNAGLADLKIIRSHNQWIGEGFAINEKEQPDQLLALANKFIAEGKIIWAELPLAT